MREIAFVVKVTDQCNLYCSYCYYYAGSANSLRKRKHSDLKSKLNRFVERLEESEVVAQADIVMIILHGGEPLMAPRMEIEEFIDQAAAVLGNKARFSIQTNGVLLDDAWAESLIQRNVSIGFSIDGPEAYHDEFRIDSRGRGTHFKTVAAYEMTKVKNRKVDLPAPGILAVYNPKISAKEYFNHFVHDLGAAGYDVLFPDDLERFPDRESLVSSYLQFVKETWELWLQHNDPKVNVRFITRALNSIHNQRGFLFDPDLQKVLVVDMNGDLFFEDNLRALVDFNELKIGSWFDDPLDVTFAIADKLMDRVREYPVECTDCKYFKACKGGMYSARLDTATNTYGLSYLCATYKEGFGQAERLLERARRKIETRSSLELS